MKSKRCYHILVFLIILIIVYFLIIVEWVIEWVPGAKSTKSGSPHWCLEMVIGPFFGRQGKNFEMMWRKMSQKLRSHIVKGVLAAKQRGLSIYCRDKTWVKRLVIQALQQRILKS